MFDLMSPCVNCPFRKGVGSRLQLNPKRLEGIRKAPAFQCHKTTVYFDETGDVAPGERPQQCAGLMATLHRDGRPNQIMQIASRLGALDLGALDPRREAYETWEAAKAAHAGNEP